MTEGLTVYRKSQGRSLRGDDNTKTISDAINNTGYYYLDRDIII